MVQSVLSLRLLGLHSQRGLVALLGGLFVRVRLGSLSALQLGHFFAWHKPCSRVSQADSQVSQFDSRL